MNTAFRILLAAVLCVCAPGVSAQELIPIRIGFDCAPIGTRAAAAAAAARAAVVRNWRRD